MEEGIKGRGNFKDSSADLYDGILIRFKSFLEEESTIP